MKIKKPIKGLIVLFILILLLSSLIPAQTGSAIHSGTAQNSKSVLIINLTGDINSGSSSLINYELSDINSSYVAAVVINLNTDSGILENMIDIVNTINSVEGQGIPVYAYTDSYATHTGAYIAMAANKTYMSGNAVIGSAAPASTGSTSENQLLMADMCSLMSEQAIEHGKNETAAVLMVENNTLYTENTALSNGVINGKSNSLTSMLATLNLSSYKIIYANESLYDQFLSGLSNPVVAGVLLLLGIVAIFLDFYHGTIILSVTGVILIALGLVGVELIGASIFGLILILIAGILIFLELKTNHGIALLAGLITGLAGIYFLGSSFDSANPGYSPSPFGLSFYATGIIIVALGIVLVFYLRNIIKSQLKNHYTGSEALIGVSGIAITDMDKNQKGFITIDGVEWEAINSGEAIKSGNTVMVTGRDGLKLIIKRM